MHPLPAARGPPGDRATMAVSQAARAQAVQLVRTLEPDVVLMDIRMPNLDGLAAARQMKLSLRDRVQAVVVAYESGLVMPEDPASRV